MTQESKAGTPSPDSHPAVQQRKLLPMARKFAQSSPPSGYEAIPAEHRIFQLDARFESAGTWAGVDRLAELAYLDLLEIGEDAIVEEHLLELYMVLLNYRDRIHPKYLSLTETVGAEERTRFYALDRAYRLVHGLVGMVLQWKRAVGDRGRWVVIVRNFDHAQHLGKRFFAELARRAAGEIDVIIETQADGFDIVPGVQAVPAARWITDLQPEPMEAHGMSEAGIRTLEEQVENGDDILLERNYSKLLAHYRSTGDGLAAAAIAVRIFVLYNSHGYYHEARTFMDTILPYFDQLVGSDEGKRIHYVSKMNFCLVMTGDPTGGLRILQELAASYLTKPYVLAGMNYILGMHYLRYAEAKDFARAERHIMLAVDNIRAARDSAESRGYSFKKVFIDNGLAFLRARQGRHQEALDLCKSGYEFLTSEMGEDRHLLHRSVLQYNIAQVYVMLGRLDEGLEYYRKAIRMDPNYSEYHNEVGNILQEQGRYQQAIESYAQAIKSSAPYPEVFFNKAVCHARLEEQEDALACFDIALELNPDQPQSYALRADLLRELGRNDEALEGYDTAIALGFDSTAVRVNRAVLHYNNGSYAFAVSDMDHVIERDPEEASHYENRAAIYQAMHREDLHLRDIALAERYKEAA